MGVNFTEGKTLLISMTLWKSKSVGVVEAVAAMSCDGRYGGRRELSASYRMTAAESWTSRRGSRSRALATWRRGGGVAVVTALRRWCGGAYRRCQPSRSISLGFEVGNGGGGGEPRTSSCQSPLPLYRAARRGPTSLFLGWAPLIRARVKGPNMAVGPSLVEINLTFSPLISSYTFNFISFTSFHISSQINA